MLKRTDLELWHGGQVAIYDGNTIELLPIEDIHEIDTRDMNDREANN